MTANLLTPILDEYTERAAALNAELTESVNAAVAKAQTNILAELAVGIYPEPPPDLICGKCGRARNLAIEEDQEPPCLGRDG